MDRPLDTDLVIDLIAAAAGRRNRHALAVAAGVTEHITRGVGRPGWNTTVANLRRLERAARDIAGPPVMTAADLGMAAGADGLPKFVRQRERPECDRAA